MTKVSREFHQLRPLHHQQMDTLESFGRYPISCALGTADTCQAGPDPSLDEIVGDSSQKPCVGKSHSY
jgi:hypothetical protein